LSLASRGCITADIRALNGGSGTGGGGIGSGGQPGTGGAIGTGGIPGGDTGGTGAGGSGTAGAGAGGTGAGGSSDGGSGVGGTAGRITDGGADATDGPVYPPPSMPGDLVITEIMADTVGPPDENGEWFELYSPPGSPTYDLYGCILFDSSPAMGNSDTVSSHIVIRAGESKTMARFGTAAGGFVPSFNYHTTILPATGMLDPDKDVKFGNNGDQVGITCGLNVIDVVVFMSWLNPPPGGGAAVVPHGYSYSLDPDHYNAMDNDTQANWCTVASVYPLPNGPDHGTPGLLNPQCTCMSPACPWGL
jgi:hypothetical protein